MRTPDPDLRCVRLSTPPDTAYRRTEDGLAVEAPPSRWASSRPQHGIVLHALAGTAELEQAFFRLVEEPDPVEDTASEAVLR